MASAEQYPPSPGVSDASSKTIDSVGCQVIFKDVSYSVQVASKAQQESKNVFEPGKLTVIMGASGAGKTSLLNVIAGEARTGDVKGDITVNGQKIEGTGMKDISGFVFQDDIILPTMTVREAISMSALLRLPKSTTPEERKKKVDDVIEELNLNKCQDTVVGDTHIKGISGGERKRTAMAMLHQPSSEIFHMFDNLLLLADGRVMYQGDAEASIPYFAKLGFPCPRRSNPADFFFYRVLNNEETEMPVFELDDLEAYASMGSLGSKGVLGKGAEVKKEDEAEQPHEGTVTSPVVQAITPSPIITAEKPLHLTIPKPYGPNNPRRESIKDLKTPPSTETNKERIQRLLNHWPQTPESNSITQSVNNPKAGGIPQESHKSMANGWIQFTYLMQRESKNAFRNPLIFRQKLAQTLFMSIFIGLLYLRGRASTLEQQRQNVMGVLFFMSINGVFISVNSNLSLFGRAKHVFGREHSSGYYTLPAYFLAKVFVEIPFQIVFPALEITIMYFMVGLDNNVGKFFALVIIDILGSLSGFSLGVCLACVFSSLPVALLAAPLIMMPMMLFSGYFVNPQLIPIWLRWLKYLSPMKYAFEGAVKSQLEGTVIGDGLIESLFSDTTLSVVSICIILFFITIMFLTMAYYSLWRLVNQSAKVVKKKKTCNQGKTSEEKTTQAESDLKVENVE
ncbi:ATP-binding cassette sub- G member 1 [Chytridiales sp. JEL 0842]|nr:ATP-binding cassette sub- G member 1 [Chytridiales sp. JEL 0842]